MMRTSQRTQLFRIATAVFGVALLAAAGLKLASPGAAVPSPVTDLLPAWAGGLVPLFEAALGVWLVSGVGRFGAWAVAVPTVTLFALHNLAQTAEGEASCGCFGAATIPPAVTLGFDVVVLALLLRGRPAWQGWPAGGPRMQAAAVAALLLAGAAVAGTRWYGSVGAALAAARGDQLALTPDRLMLGPVAAGGTVERSLRVANLSAESVQIVLGESNCSCVEVRGLPVTIAPGAWADVPVTVTVSTTPGRFKRKAALRTSAGDLTYAVTASVTAGKRDPGTPPGPDAKEVRP